jgi:predicted phage-related endonuclease
VTYEIVNVVPDTPEWEQERRRSVGASEAPAVMNMSSYGVTPLDVYRQKNGIDRDFDPLLGWIGHQSEPIMHAWVEQFSGLGLTLTPGFMARSVEHAFLHATFDRVATNGVKVQMKTAHHYTGHHWDEGIPTDIRVQVQAEMAVSGDAKELVVVWIGGREFRHYWEPRDNRFIDEYLLPQLHAFWHDNVLAGVAPDPSTIREINEIPTDRDVPVDLSEEAFDVLERITVLNSDIEAMGQERDALKVALAQYTGTADTLTHQGVKVATWRQQKGRVGFDKAGFAADHPDLLTQYTTIGAPFRVLRRTQTKEKK